MARTKPLARIAVFLIFASMLAMAGGCGGVDPASVEPPRGPDGQRNARIEAYGKSGMPNAVGKSTKPAASRSRTGG